MLSTNGEGLPVAWENRTEKADFRRYCCKPRIVSISGFVASSKPLTPDTWQSTLG